MEPTTTTSPFDPALEAAAAALPIHLRDRDVASSSVLALTGTEEDILEALHQIEEGLVDRFLKVRPWFRGRGGRTAARIYGQIPDLAATYYWTRHPEEKP